MNRLEKTDIQLAEMSLRIALEKGADMARVSLSKSIMDLVGTLNGEVDKVTHNLSMSINIYLFVNQRFGSFSTNRLSPEELESFIIKALDIVRNVEPDSCRQLPDPSRTAQDAQSGLELDLYDERYESIEEEERIKTALKTSVFAQTEGTQEWSLISEEIEYSDSLTDTLTLDTNGLICRHTETSFDFYACMTIQDKNGNKYSGYWWDSTPCLDKLDISSCVPTALRKAIEQIGPKSIDGGKYTMVISNECSAKVVSPLLYALNGYSIQQNNSFLMDSLGKRMFPEGLTITDNCRARGQGGCRLFDSEGVSTKEDSIIEKGVVKKYFINTYMAGKLNMDPTIEDATRPCVLPFPEKGASLPLIMEKCSEGILVTGFNGGNSNSVTGDFSYGIEGFLFREGKIVHPVREMLVTGNFLRLWSNLIAAGDDYRRGTQKQVPTLAFKDVDFSA